MNRKDFIKLLSGVPFISLLGFGESEVKADDIESKPTEYIRARSVRLVISGYEDDLDIKAILSQMKEGSYTVWFMGEEYDLINHEMNQGMNLEMSWYGGNIEKYSKDRIQHTFHLEKPYGRIDVNSLQRSPVFVEMEIDEQW